MAFLLAAELLVWSGVAKLLRPDSTVPALRAVRFPASPFIARAMGTAELAIGSLCFALPSRPLALVVSAFYLAFAGFVLASLTGVIRTDDCGCFGSEGSAPSWLHLGMNLAAAAAAAGVVLLSKPPQLVGFVMDAPASGIVLLVGLATAGYLAVQVMTKLPALASSFRSTGTS